jgi:hypothetical protein
MNVIKLSAICIAITILLCSSLCIAESQKQDFDLDKYIENEMRRFEQLNKIYNEYGRDSDDFPVKKATSLEIVGFENRLNDCEDDFHSIMFLGDIDKSDLQAAGILNKIQIRMLYSFHIITRLIFLERAHANNSDDPNAIGFIRDVIEEFILNADNWKKNITDMTRLTGNSMILIQCDKLKAIARDTKRLMQEFVKELNETIEIAKRKYDEKLLE